MQNNIEIPQKLKIDIPYIYIGKLAHQSLPH